MTEYDNLKFFTNKIINERKVKKFASTLFGDALEFILPDFTSTFTEISVRVNFDDSNNFTFTNYRINSSGDILTRKDKKVELTTDKKGNKYYILMINGRAYKKTTEELLKQNF